MFSKVCCRECLFKSRIYCYHVHRTCFGKPTGKYKKALHAFNHLKDAIANAPDVDPILKEATNHGLTEEEAVLEILWMLK